MVLAVGACLPLGDHQMEIGESEAVNSPILKQPDTSIPPSLHLSIFPYLRKDQVSFKTIRVDLAQAQTLMTGEMQFIFSLSLVPRPPSPSGECQAKAKRAKQRGQESQEKRSRPDKGQPGLTPQQKGAKLCPFIPGQNYFTFWFSAPPVQKVCRKLLQINESYERGEGA